MAQAKKKIPAVEGWFHMGTKEPHLLGTQCVSCKSYFFPKETTFCRNPDCAGTEFEEVPLSRTGTLWSFTNNCYQPPAPYMSPDPFVPYVIAAVELPKEKIVILGQVVAGVGIPDLSAGMRMDVVLDKLYEDDDNEYLTWKWKPAA
jgi:hypothetical protein